LRETLKRHQHALCALSAAGYDGHTSRQAYHHIVGKYDGQDGGTTNKEYCKFCFQNIGFTMPDITVDDMVRILMNFL
jgi:hypothetical protein